MQEVGHSEGRLSEEIAWHVKANRPCIWMRHDDIVFPNGTSSNAPIACSSNFLWDDIAIFTPNIFRGECG